METSDATDDVSSFGLDNPAMSHGQRRSLLPSNLKSISDIASWCVQFGSAARNGAYQYSLPVLAAIRQKWIE